MSVSKNSSQNAFFGMLAHSIPAISFLVCVVLAGGAADAGIARLVPPDQNVALGEGEVRVRSLGELRKLLREDLTITEVIVHDGQYVGGCSIDVPDGLDPKQSPLLIRAADGASPVFIGSMPLDGAEPVDGAADVWSAPYQQVGNEMPKLWDPVTRVRYRYVADLAAVRFFPASFTVQDDRLYVRVHGDGDIADLRRNHPYIDFGFFIRRPHTTVRGITFRDYLLREKWSTGVQLRADHVTVEDCIAINCSLGFTAVKNNTIVRRCRVEDCGGGVYVGGENVTVEDCRIFKIRDRFKVPMYHQDDAGVQFYYPARGGVIRGNLCVGFSRGIFIKAHSAPYLIERNTIDGRDHGVGFGATKWGEGQICRGNIFANCTRALELPEDVPPRDMQDNCIEADPGFAAPKSWDYRLKNDSPCLGRGALPALGEDAPRDEVIIRNDMSLDLETPAPIDLLPRASDDPRRWFIAPRGRDAAPGDENRPLRTVQAAVDRAVPGDEIILLPGIYPHPIHVTRGGTADKPLVIRAAKRWTAILDSNRQVDRMIHLEGVSHVIIRDLEIRWYGKDAIRPENCSDITVEGCRIWNAPWYGTWPTGSAIRCEHSPRLTVRRNVMFAQEHGAWLHGSPHSTVTHNTATRHVYTAATFLESEYSTCVNNNFAFQGNDVIAIRLWSDSPEKLDTFDIDYNNYGTVLRQAPKDVPFDSIEPRDRDKMLDGGSKAIVGFMLRQDHTRFHTMSEWRDFSGHDAHTLFVDPLFVDAANRDFRLQSDSPLIGAGRGGATIGAHPLP